MGWRDNADVVAFVDTWTVSFFPAEFDALADQYVEFAVATNGDTHEAVQRAYAAAYYGNTPSEVRLVDELDLAVRSRGGEPSLPLVRAKRKAEAEGLPWPPVNFPFDGHQTTGPWDERYLPVEYLDRDPATVPPVWRGVARPSITGIPGFVDISGAGA